MYMEHIDQYRDFNITIVVQLCGVFKWWLDTCMCLQFGAWNVSQYNYPMCVGGHGIVVVWFVCLFVICKSAYLDAIALRLQHG